MALAVGGTYQLHGVAGLEGVRLEGARAYVLALRADGTVYIEAWHPGSRRQRLDVRRDNLRPWPMLATPGTRVQLVGVEDAAYEGRMGTVDSRLPSHYLVEVDGVDADEVGLLRVEPWQVQPVAAASAAAAAGTAAAAQTRSRVQRLTVGQVYEIHSFRENDPRARLNGSAAVVRGVDAGGVDAHVHAVGPPESVRVPHANLRPWAMWADVGEAVQLRNTDTGYDGRIGRVVGVNNGDYIVQLDTGQHIRLVAWQVTPPPAAGPGPAAGARAGPPRLTPVGFRACAGCGLFARSMGRCPHCREARFCSRACWHEHWREHRAVCPHWPRGVSS